MRIVRLVEEAFHRDDEDRPLREIRTPPAYLRAGDIEHKACPYAGSRARSGCPINVGALRQASAHWPELIDALDRHFRYLGASGELTRRRRARWREQILEVAEQRLRRRVWGDAGIQAFIEAALPDVEAGTSTPFGIADELLRRGAGILTRTVT